MSRPLARNELAARHAVTVGGSRRVALAVSSVTLAVAVAVIVFSGSAGADAPPGPQPNFAGDVVSPRPCALDTNDAYERSSYEREGWSGPDYVRYPKACERLHFSFGPLLIKPGQNDVLINPVTIEKPEQDGYVTRFKPNLVDQYGHVPPVEQMHLHHGTLLSVPLYGNEPAFLAAGEEKTILSWPKGYGMPIKRSDHWELLYMVHSAVPQTRIAYITYDIDFVPQAKAAQLALKAAYPIWLDVVPNVLYPVFNAQRGYGQGGVCTWPKQECAAVNPYGKLSVGQGQPGNGVGADVHLPKAGGSMGKMQNFTGGTLIAIAGHLHPGGIQNEVDLVRPGGENVTSTEAYRVRVRRMVCVRRHHRRCVKKKRAKRRRFVYVTRYRRVTKHVVSARIYDGRAHYWDHQDHNRDGGPRTSWDFSMEVQALPHWGVRVRPGDILRSNVSYDTNTFASYENMGISVALLAPNDAHGKPTAPGVDPLQAGRDPSPDCQSGPAINGKLCDVGAASHGHYAENGNYSGPSGVWGAIRPGLPTQQVSIANFLYIPGDLSTVNTTGVPQVKLGTNLAFDNTEGAGIYHTVTACAFPCLGPTGSAFPLANGATSSGRQLDFDSSELGVGPPAVGAASETLRWTLPVGSQTGFKPGEIVTYYCRIHPFMRGAFLVVK